MACGRLVIVSAVGGILEQVKCFKNAPGGLGRFDIENSTGLLVWRGKLQELSDTFDYLLKQDKVRFCLGENAYKIASLQLGLDKQAFQYLD